MRQLAAIFTLVLAVQGAAAPAQANCMVIDQIDRIYTIQTRMARDPDTGLFATDIRLLRTTMRRLSNDAALDAVDGNALVGRGADIVRMLRQTNELLERVSLDDPQSVRPHFHGSARRTLSAVGDHLHDLRCTRDQINIDRAAAAATKAPGATTDAEDLAQVLQALGTFRQEALRPRNLLGVAVGVAVILAVAPSVKRWLILRRRRAKRHPANYKTRYRQEDVSRGGSLLDINCFGTKLARPADEYLDVGTAIEIAIEGDWIKGSVVWSNQHYSGIQFKPAISLAQVNDVIGSGATV